MINSRTPGHSGTNPKRGYVVIILCRIIAKRGKFVTDSGVKRGAPGGTRTHGTVHGKRFLKPGKSDIIFIACFKKAIRGRIDFDNTRYNAYSLITIPRETIVEAFSNVFLYERWLN
jgi:hypothetical protein